VGEGAIVDSTDASAVAAGLDKEGVVGLAGAAGPVLHAATRTTTNATTGLRGAVNERIDVSL